MTISQELLLREDVFRLVCVGVKCSTLRKGRRDIKTGPLAFKMTENPKIQMVVNVTKVTYLSLAEITENEATEEGYTLMLTQFYIISTILSRRQNFIIE